MTDLWGFSAYRESAGVPSDWVSASSEEEQGSVFLLQTPRSTLYLQKL